MAAMNQTDPSFPPRVLRQTGRSKEVLAVGQACLTNNIDSLLVCADQLAEHSLALRAGEVLPVGSVEFMRVAMTIAGIEEPDNLSYPPSMRPLLGRDLGMLMSGEIVHRCFVKPVQTKQFTGFIYDPDRADEEYDAHDREQLDVLRSLPGLTPMWISSPVKFDAEWRCYVLDGRVLGMARYDPDGPEDVAEPDPAWIVDAISRFSSAHDVRAYALDVGRLDNDELALVEVNDGWAIGLYGRSMKPEDYVRFLWARWSQLQASRGLDAQAQSLANRCELQGT